MGRNIKLSCALMYRRLRRDAQDIDATVQSAPVEKCPLGGFWFKFRCKTVFGAVSCVIEVPYTYPFSPPRRIWINGMNYRLLLKSKAIQRLLYPHCACCDTILCHFHQWSPSHNLIMVRKEILQNLGMLRRTAELIMAKSLVRQLLFVECPVPLFIHEFT